MSIVNLYKTLVSLGSYMLVQQRSNRYSTLHKIIFPLPTTLPFTMKFIGTIAFSLTVAVAMGAKLTDSAAFDHAKSQCDVGDISCCNSEEDTKADGILGNLLAGGLLNGVLGNSNSPCAKTSLIDELNILGRSTFHD